MRILAISDTTCEFLWEHFDRNRLEGTDLIVSCGDLPAEYLEFLVTMTNLPLVYVPGNHDDRYEQHAPQGCRNIDGDAITIDGVRIAGLGGSLRYKDGPYMHTEQEMAARIRRLNRRMWLHRTGRPDIIVTHAPVAGYGDLPDLPHRGFECFNKLIEQHKPKLFLHGHVHPEYCARLPRVIEHPCGTIMYNCCGFAFIEI